MTSNGEKSRHRSPSPMPSMHSLPRLLLGSPRRLAGFVGWLCLLYVGWQYLGTSSRTRDTSGNLLCDPQRLSLSRNIGTPKTPDVALLNSTWLTLEIIFQAHPPHPEKLPQIPFKNGYEMPELELIKNHTELSMSDAKLSRESHLEVVNALPEYPKDTFSGRGVIMLAGGRYNLYAATALGVIRETGSKLPVEVWFNETSEGKEGWCDELAKEGMVCKWLSDYVDGRFLQNGYQLKILTMMFSSFEQFLFLDADNQPVKNPDTIFDTKSFKDNGAILWPDYWDHTGAPLLPYVVGLTDEASDMWLKKGTRTVESGQIVWDKSRHWKSLCLAAYYNHYGPDFYYTMVTQGFAGWGDKDTFPLALKALKEDYYMVPFGLNTMFLHNTTTGVAMMQADPANQTGYEPLFLHTNIVKWNPREFLCIGCASDDEDPVEISDIEKEESFTRKSLLEHERIYDYGVPKKLGIDPEPLLWKSMEHNVCKSAWLNEDLCSRIREHMEHALGFRFRTRTVSRVFRDGYEVEEVCRLQGA